MKFRPLHDRVVIKRLEEHKTKGGILIPDTAAEKPQTGKVIAAVPVPAARTASSSLWESRPTTRCCSANGPAPRSRSTRMSSSS